MESELLYSAAPGKINLFLKVTGKRCNGYHELESLFLPLTEPADDIAIDKDALPGAITVGSSDIMLPGGTGNIAGRAAELWAKKSATVPHWDINIVKNIPVAAGMGGGSSDAAAVLKLLNRDSGNALDKASLHETALELGADVPFFLDPKPSIMTGVGEIASELDFTLPELHLVLIAPEFPISAAEGYKLMPAGKISPMDPALRNDIMQALRSHDTGKLATLIFNDLQDGVFNKYPILPLLARAACSCGALNCLMTGSGPTLFAICRDEKNANEVMAQLKEKFPQFNIFRARQLQIAAKGDR